MLLDVALQTEFVYWREEGRLNCLCPQKERETGGSGRLGFFTRRITSPLLQRDIYCTNRLRSLAWPPRQLPAQLAGGVSEFGLGVGVFLVKKLVSGLMPRVETFFSCRTPRLSALVVFFFFFSASSLSSAERLFGIPKVLIASLPPDEIEAEDEAADKLGVGRLLLDDVDPSPMPVR